MDTHTIITHLNGLPRIFEAAQVTTFKCYRELDDGRIQDVTPYLARTGTRRISSPWVESEHYHRPRRQGGTQMAG